jgi:hypothetical protein
MATTKRFLKYCSIFITYVSSNKFFLPIVPQLKNEKNGVA